MSNCQQCQIVKFSNFQIVKLSYLKIVKLSKIKNFKIFIAHQHQHHHHDQMVSESVVLCQSDDDQQNINQQYQQSRYILPDGKRFRYADDVVQGDFLSCQYDAAFPGRVFFRIVAKCLD